MFTVTASQPTYWRFAALDVYNGRLWNSSNLDASGGQKLDSGALASSPVVDPNPNSRVIRQRFQFQNLAQEWLPAAYDPIAMASPDRCTRVRDSTTEPKSGLASPASATFISRKSQLLQV